MAKIRNGKTLVYAMRDFQGAPLYHVGRSWFKTILEGNKVVRKHRSITGMRAMLMDNGCVLLMEYQTAKQIRHNRGI